MKTTTKPKKMEIQNEQELLATVDAVCLDEIELRRLVAKRDAKIAEVREKHDPEIEEIKKSMKAKLDAAEAFCLPRRESIFQRAKSAFSAQGRFGFRDGQPTLCLLNKKWSWDMVLQRIKGALPQFVRTIEEVDKEAIKASKMADGDLAEIGLRIDAKERFFIEPKADEAERLTTG